MKPEIKKQIILHLPYLAFVYLFGKVGQAFRLAQGVDISAKLLHIGQGFSAAFASAAPSFHPSDLLIGLAAAVIIRLVVYSKQKNAKKYRKGMEYGTARWGTAADIKPFIDPVFDNNVLLTATLGKVDSVENGNAVFCPLQKLSHFANQAAFGVSNDIRTVKLHDIGLAEKTCLSAARAADDKNILVSCVLRVFGAVGHLQFVPCLVLYKFCIVAVD